MKADRLATDLLEQKFGSLRIEVVKQTAQERIVCILAKSDDRPLEWTLVKFNAETIEQYKEIHKAVTGGAFMGKTFRRAGVAFKRQELASFQYLISAKFKKLFNIKAGKLSVKYVSIRIGAQQHEYARNLEVYSPQVPWPHQTRQSTKDHRNTALKLLKELEMISVPTSSL